MVQFHIYEAIKIENNFETGSQHQDLDQKGPKKGLVFTKKGILKGISQYIRVQIRV